MSRKAPAVLVVTLLLCVRQGGSGAQEPHLPEPARAVLKQPVDSEKLVPGSESLPVPLNAPEACSPHEDCNGRLLAGDPLLDPPCSAPPGWFAAFEVGILAPVYKSNLTGTVPIAGLPNQTVTLSSACLSWTGSPRVELGYRFAQGFGEFLVSYRSMVAEGSEVIPAFDIAGAGTLASRLNLNVVDIDYASNEFSLGELWDMRWKAGARLVTNYFDSRAQGVLLGQRVSNNYVGAGPHAGLDVARRFGQTGLAWFGKTDAAITTGRNSQSFEETFSLGGVPVLGGADAQKSSQYVPILRVQTGVSWTLSLQGRPLKLLAGYEFEEWWWVGRLYGPTTESTANLPINGLFLRAEWNY